MKWILAWCTAGAVFGQTLTLEEAVQQAWEKYPAIRVTAEQAASAAAGIEAARTAYLPRADLVGQINRATRNNVFGLLLPQSVISPISGPVLGRTALTNVWGTAAGLLVSWEPFDFGARRAQVEAAGKARDRAEAETAVRRLEVGAAAADAFLTVLAAGQLVKAAQASVERAQVLDQSVQALVKAELRPGADGSRAQAELVQARTQWIQAEKAERMARAALAQWVGREPGSLEAGRLLRTPAGEAAGGGVEKNPRVAAQAAAVEVVKAREKVLERSYFPKFSLQGTTFARGSGARPDGTTGGAGSGLGPNFYNWALGMTVTFPMLDLPALRARKQTEVHNERAEVARQEQVVQELNAEAGKARAGLEGARRVAENTPLGVQATRTLVEQATARYQAGLGTIVEVAEAQRLLSQAEIDDALAALGVWRALLALRAAEGDVGVYLGEVR